MNSDVDYTQVLQRKLERERRARLEAEAIAERSTRDLYIKQQELALLSKISAASNEAASVRRSFAKGENGNASCARIWHVRDGGNYSEFQIASESIVFPQGSGLPGRVVASGFAAWISDVCDDAGFIRSDIEKRVGLHLGAAFPVLAGKRIPAVVEFFSLVIDSLRSVFLDLMT